MDETHFWTDLLECSVCLEQLDINNKVLPCQHTFCKKCLNRIVNTHKELRCPECRVEVDVKVDDLPTNILLVRLLEGIKNNPKLSLTHQKNASNSSSGQPFTAFKPAFVQSHSNELCSRSETPHIQQQQQQSLPLSNREISQNNVPVKPVLSSNLPRAKALFNYDGKEPGDLSFKKGDVIIIRKRIDPNWFYGELGTKLGYLPASYVQVLVPPSTPVPPQCKALYDFRVTDVEEKDCLSFNKGDIITVIRRVDENWAEGKLNERVGIFPITFVEMNVAAKALMKLSTSSVIGPSRTAPPTPLSDATTSKIKKEVPSVDESSTSSCSSSTTSPSSAPCTPSSTSSSSSSIGLGIPPVTTTALSLTVTTTSFTSTCVNSSVKSPVTTQSATTVYDRVFIQRSATSNQKRHSLCVPAAGSYGLPLPYQRSTSQTTDVTNAAVTQQHRHSMEILSNETGANLFDVSSNNANELVRNNAVRSSWRRETSLLETRVPVSHSPPVPVYYVAMYNYKPQKTDEVELRKGELYTVNEKCQDGWYKGTSLRTGVSGVFPGNYVQLAKSSLPQPQYQQSQQQMVTATRVVSPVCDSKNVPAKTDIAPPPRPRPVVPTRPAESSAASLASTTSSSIYARPRPVPSSSSTAASQGIAGLFDWAKNITSVIPTPPQRPPRSSYVTSPTACNSEDTSVTSCHASPQWHQPKVAATRHSSVSSNQPTSMRVCSPTPSSVGSVSVNQEKKDHNHKREKISLMKRLTSKRKSKSPPPVTNGFSCDNPSFVSTSPPQNLVLANPSTSNLPTVHIRSGSCPNEVLKGTHHKKCSSNDESSKTCKLLIKERYRCIVPYPPNTEYELELQIGDVVYVQKKREDGWFRGTLEKNGKVGLFPGSFVESF